MNAELARAATNQARRNQFEFVYRAIEAKANHGLNELCHPRSQHETLGDIARLRSILRADGFEVDISMLASEGYISIRW